MAEVILTDLDQVGPSWYALRFWMSWVKALKSLGWKWDKTRRTDPTRRIGHLAPGWRTPRSGGLLQATASAGSQVVTLGAVPRTVSGSATADWLRRLEGRLWSRVWLLPEPWPEPKLNLEIIHVPP